MRAIVHNSGDGRGVTGHPAASAARGVALRSARPGDIAVLTAIYAHHVRHGLASFEIEPPDEEEMARRHDGICSLGFPYLVAEVAGIIAGYAYAGPYRTRPGYRYTVEDSVYIHHEYAGRGIGSVLLPALIAACEAAGCRQMIAVIGDSANWPSIRLHEKFGFARVGLLPAVGYKFGRWVDSVLMQRALGEDIDIRFSAAPGLGQANADRAQLEAALLNLALNARDAMPTGGRLTIEASRMTVGIGKSPPGEWMTPSPFSTISALLS